MEYQKTVQKIHALNWKWLISQNDLTRLMYLAYITATEFAESLKIACWLYPQNENLKKMAEGELETDNLNFSDYNKKGDHFKFLEFFLSKYGVLLEKNISMASKSFYPRYRAVGQNVIDAAEKYLRQIRLLDDNLRAMSIFSREQELPGIFTKILQNQIFDYPELETMLSAYKYYLERHIELDSIEGGHADLTKGFELTDDLDLFYQARLNLYLESFPIFKEK